MTNYLQQFRTKDVLHLEDIFAELIKDQPYDERMITFLVKTLPSIKTRAGAAKYALDNYGPRTAMTQLIKSCGESGYFHVPELLREWSRLKKPFGSFDLPIWENMGKTDEREKLLEFIDMASKACRSNKKMMSELFVASVQIGSERLAHICSKNSSPLPEDQGDELFKLHKGKMQYYILSVMNDTSKARLFSSIENRDSEIFNDIAAMAKFLNPKELAWVHSVVGIGRYSIAEFIFALDSGNLELVSDMILLEHPKFISKANILTNILFALGRNPYNADWAAVWKYINSIVQRDVKIRGNDTIELMCTEFFSRKRGLLINLVDWQDTKIDQSRAYGVICDETLCELLDKNGVLSGWSTLQSVPKFRIYPWMPINTKAIDILTKYDYI